MSLYVQLSRAERWDGLYVFRKPARDDFIEPKNVLDEDMREGVVRLERLGETTRRCFERDQRYQSWFQDRDAMPEAAPISSVRDEDTSLWCDSEASEVG